MKRKLTALMICVSILFGYGFAFKPTTVHACSCAVLPDVKTDMARHTAVFSGKVERIKEPAKGLFWSTADLVEVEIAVDRVWKGRVEEKATVYTARSSVSCGYEGFSVNQEYLVFATGEPDELNTGNCERTKSLDSSGEELAALGEGYPPEPAARSLKEGKGSNAERAVVTAAVSVLLIVAAWVLILREASQKVTCGGYVAD